MSLPGDSQRPAVTTDPPRGGRGLSPVTSARALSHATPASSPSCQTTRVLSGNPPGRSVTTGQPDSTSAAASFRFIRVIRRLYVMPVGAINRPPSTASHCSSEVLAHGRHGSAHLLRGALSGPLWDAPRPSGDLTCAEVLAVAMPSRWIRAHTWTRRFGSAPKSWTPPRQNRRKRHPDGVTKSGMADMNGDTVPIAGATDREGDRRRCSPSQRGRESWGHSAVGPSRSAQGRSRGFAQRFPSTSARIPFSVLARQRPSIAVGSSP